MHVWKSCFLFTLVAVLGLLVVPAAADPPECPAGSYGCPAPGCDVPTCRPPCPYDACPPACLPVGHCDLDPCCPPDCCEDECCCEEDCSNCCDGETCDCPCNGPACCEGCPNAAKLHQWIARQIVRAAGGQAGCCRPACCKSTVKQGVNEAIQAACTCGCGCKNCTCGKGRVAGRCPFGFVAFGKRIPARCPIGHPPEIFHKVAKLMAENAALKARLEMHIQHVQKQRALEHSLMEARQQIAQINGAHQIANPQDRMMAQWIETQAEQMARKDEVLVELMGAIVQMRAEGSTGAATENAIDKLEAKIEKLEYSLKRVHEQNAKLRARLADVIKERRSVQHRIKANRSRYNCDEGSDIKVQIERVRRPSGCSGRDTSKDAACEGSCTRSTRQR